MYWGCQHFLPLSPQHSSYVLLLMDSGAVIEIRYICVLQVQFALARKQTQWLRGKNVVRAWPNLVHSINTFSSLRLAKNLHKFGLTLDCFIGLFCLWLPRLSRNLVQVAKMVLVPRAQTRIQVAPHGPDTGMGPGIQDPHPGSGSGLGGLAALFSWHSRPFHP